MHPSLGEVLGSRKPGNPGRIGSDFWSHLGKNRSCSTSRRRGVRVLPVVVAAEIIAGTGTLAGFVILIIPGVILLIRWAVVAPAEAIESVDGATAGLNLLVRLPDAATENHALAATRAGGVGVGVASKV
jgi:hypothetical protein